MLLDPSQVPAPEMYRFLISAVVPRPIAFVSTRAVDGTVNLAPFSYFNAISSTPPLVGISIVDRPGDAKDTLLNIRETGELVVNLVCEPMLAAMAKTAGDWPRGTSEFEIAGLTPAPSERVSPPYVLESPLQLECRLHREIPLGNAFLVVGEVVLARVSDDALTEGRIDPMKLAPVGRLGGDFYSLMREVVKERRPRVSRATGAPLG
jgi:flavin reductase (DIM6/NTAB) family NADH-FMN oxidoreductase RutF